MSDPDIGTFNVKRYIDFIEKRPQNMFWQTESGKKWFLKGLVIFLAFLFVVITTITLILVFGKRGCGLEVRRQAHEKGDETKPPILNCTYGYVTNGKSCDECGVTFITPNARIKGGIDAVPHSWPSQVAIVQQYKGVYYLNNEFVDVVTYSLCSGTLIDRKTVVTAAHCAPSLNFSYTRNSIEYNLLIQSNDDFPNIESTYSIYFGAHEIGFVNESSIKLPLSGIKKPVHKIIRHEQYDTVNNLNDIALFKLAEPIELNEEIQLACLPQHNSFSYPLTNQAVYAMGWGLLSDSDFEQPDDLNNVKLKVLNNSDCSLVLIGMAKDWNSQFCAGDPKYVKDTCLGDSGAGLLLKESISNKERYVISGIVSMGEGCGRKRRPGIYTRISHYLDWIKAYSN